MLEELKSQQMPDRTIVRYRLQRAIPPSHGVVVLIHGMASNMTRWSEFVDHTRLKEHWDILRIDLRGHGESFSRTRIGMRVWSDDLLHVLDSEHYPRAVLVGHSLGAHVAAHFAARHPNRIAGLALLDPAFHDTLRGKLRFARLLTPLMWLAIAGLRLLNALGLRRRAFPHRDLRALDEETRRELLDAGNPEEFVRQYSSPFSDFKFFSVAHYLQELLETLRPLPSLAEMHAPTLVLLSAGVTYTDPEVTKRMIEKWPNAVTKTVDAYHWPLTEKPQEVREAIEAWCDGLRASVESRAGLPL